MMPNQTHSDRRFVWGVIIVMVVITSLPYIFGVAAGAHYSGRHGLAPGDFSNYYQMIQQAREGRVLFSDPFTSEPQQATVFNPFWLLVGQLGRFTSWSNAFIFQLARVLTIPLLVGVLYWLIRQVFTDTWSRRMGLLFIVGASGVGAWSLLWLPRFVDIHANNLLNQPIDLWVSEAVTFLTMFQTAHFIVATALIIVVLVLMYRGLTQQRWLPIWWASAAGLFLFFFHPFHVPTVFGVLGVYFVVQCIVSRRVLWTWLTKLALFTLATMPAWLYQILLVWIDPIAAGRAEQNVNTTPALWNILLGYGFLIPFAVGGIWWLIKHNRLRGLYGLLLTWLMVQFVLIYIPIDWQRRLTHGLQVPLSIFAIVGIIELYRAYRNKHTSILVPGVASILAVTILAISNVYVFANDFSTLSNNYYHKPIYSYYYPDSMVHAFEWIRSSVEPGEPILAHTITSNQIVGETARTVFVGHSVETLNAVEKNAETHRFFDEATSDQERRQLLGDNHIAYVFYGPIERYYGWHNPDFLPVAYADGDVVIYRVAQ